MKNRISAIALFLAAIAFGQSEEKLFPNSNHIDGYGGVNLMLNPARKLAFFRVGSFI